MSAAVEHRLMSAFGQGASCAARGGYLADNPHERDSETWQAWREGFAYEQRHAERVAEQQAAT